MSRIAAASISLLTLLVAAGCARQFTPAAPPATVPPAVHTVNVIAKDKWFGGCELEVTPRRVNARNGQSIRWVLSVRDPECGPATAPVKIVMKWRDCRDRANSQEPLDFDAPGTGFQVARVKGMAVTQQQCFQYGVFAGSLFADPELILDL
jgi:hypothetical protein